MRPPKLPGAEKFKFADKTKSSIDDTSSTGSSGSSSRDSCSSPAANMFIRGHLTRSTCPSVSSTNTFNVNSNNGHHSLDFCRSDSRRRAILPITSPMTSRVLSSTDLPLNSFYIQDSRHKKSYATLPSHTDNKIRINSNLSSSEQELRSDTSKPSNSMKSTFHLKIFPTNEISAGIPQVV
ncbi:uncharacterized protein B4U80_09228 [Leptotrombidium deliense]|uniref:Uncharacterized protein n=1 Tax=Leptotrombidium deliense TaxID=299467 RepID=A0A443SEV4_9ACAR|nr:uncharacterized protein B4U80_09228 [Leptotrombidium deliense]